MVPCSTPHLRVVKLERQPLTKHRCVRLVKYDLNQSRVFPDPHRNYLYPIKPDLRMVVRKFYNIDFFFLGLLPL